MPEKPKSESQQAQSKTGEHSHARLEERSFEEVYELAGELGIPGRDGMTKPELIEAIRRR
ncbi:MAG: hypothetical protein DCC71_23820 [Proteobacteria bacterium]|nr:MAG: hypothetical protein DCC71_23820 [Pseudomonadota bacterium]